MPTIVVPDGFQLERLDTSRHSRNEFSCGKAPLDTFLRTQASQAQGKYLSATHVLIQSGITTASGMFPIVGFITLVSSEIPLAECPPFLKRISNKPRLPALLLAQMAVDLAHAKKGLGKSLLAHALVTAWQINQSSGCLLVILDAKDDEAKDFYLRHGFTAMLDKPMRMFLPMATIQNL